MHLEVRNMENVGQGLKQMFWFQKKLRFSGKEDLMLQNQILWNQHRFRT
jgi:hypothetical protein